MRSRVLLTGASGSVGREVFQELMRRKDRYLVRVLSIDAKLERKLFKPFQDEVEIVWGDIRKSSIVNQAVKGVDVVLHIAGIIPPAADSNPGMAYDVNVKGTQNIVSAILRQPHLPKLLFTSSISVYGDRLDQPYITINDPLIPSEGDEYARTKIEAEKIIQKSGIQWTIFRLCGIFTNHVKVQPLMFHMPLDTSLEWCHPSDAGFALVEGIEHEELLNRVFNLGGGLSCRTKARDFMKVMFSIWGLDKDILPEFAFAVQNFHSGYYLDGDDLNQILKFQRKSLSDYIEAVRLSISPIYKDLVSIIPKPIIRNWFLRMSEPLKAIHENNDRLINRFYGSRQKFYELAKV